MTMLAPPPMPTALPAPAKPVAPTTPVPPSGERVLLPHISWGTYQALLADIGDGAARLTYDTGWLEIEMPGRTHESTARFTGELVTRLLSRQRIDYEPSGATTWQRPDLEKGLEADECYHIQSVARVAGRDELDLTVDPPPDLAIEVEAASPLLDKVAVYRGLGVPELWRVRADRSCEFLRLDADRQYQPAAASAAVPPLTPAIVSQYLRVRAEASYSAAIAQFEAEFPATVVQP